MVPTSHAGPRHARHRPLAPGRAARAARAAAPLAGLLLASACLAAACATSEPTAPPGASGGGARAGNAVPGDTTARRALVAAGGADRALTNGGNHAGRIAAAGEIDSWTFVASRGVRISVNLTGLSGTLAPGFEVVDPTGAVVASARGPGGVAVADFNAPAPGTYTVLVSDARHDAGTGDYQLMLMRLPGTVAIPPGDQGGPLCNGGSHSGTIARGDRDAWTFTAARGTRVAVHLTGRSGTLTPGLQVVGPTGAVVASAWGPRGVARADFDAPAPGTYTVVVGDAEHDRAGAGEYRLTGTRWPGDPGARGRARCGGAAGSSPSPTPSPARVRVPPGPPDGGARAEPGTVEADARTRG